MKAEANPTFLRLNLWTLFLMHRVELKDVSGTGFKFTSPVPNAPCGVERSILLP
jgi:hypothetical protein